jgi:hypothetical protein
MTVPAGWVPTTPVHGNVMVLAPGAGAICQEFFQPLGQAPVDEEARIGDGYAVDTTETTDESRAVYLGKAGKAFTAAAVTLRVDTACIAATWAEVAICTGYPSTLTKLTTAGWTDITGYIDTTGRKVIPISLMGLGGVVGGDHLWLVWGCKYTPEQAVMPTYFASVRDAIQSGFFRFASTTRPSTMGAETTFDLEGATKFPLWAVVGFA